MCYTNACFGLCQGEQTASAQHDVDVLRKAVEGLAKTGQSKTGQSNTGETDSGVAQKMRGLFGGKRKTGRVGRVEEESSPRKGPKVSERKYR